MKPFQSLLSLNSRMRHFDKLLHFGVGMGLQMLLRYISPTVGLALVSFVAWMKEDRDGRGYGTKDGWDAFATVVGAVFVECVAEAIAIIFGVRAPALFS